jgi:hypothetical protein
MTTTSLVPSRLFRRTEAAQYIKEKWGYPCSPRTLAKYAVIGGGPGFRKAGRYPLYHSDDLDRWVSDKLSDLVTSTSALARNPLSWLEQNRQNTSPDNASFLPVQKSDKKSKGGCHD